ncbi:DUF4479 domain-containing protein [Jeotgalicoccus huakuii]|nr:DUF4479 domain-containing protein [Jeotgalicoccus huakuii]
MRITYNKDHIGDVLLVTMKKADTVSYDTKGDITLIKDGNEVIGLNIFNASSHFDDLDASYRDYEKMVPLINELLSKNDIESLEFDLKPKFIVGKVIEKTPHPDADKLNVTKVDVGTELLQIVCGAPNVDVEQKVVVACNGAIMPNGLYIKPSVLRGVNSNGMICSKKELNLEDDGVKGIYILDDSYNVGQIFSV